MGLFDKRSAKKKLKEITGGFLLSDSFMEILKDNGLSAEEGYKIQSEVKDSIKSGDIDVDGVELRVYYLISQYAKEKSKLSKETKSTYSKYIPTNPKIKTLKFRINQEHNIKKCSECGAILLKDDDYCYKCGCLIENESKEEYVSKVVNKSSKVVNENSKVIKKENKHIIDEGSPLNSNFKKVEISYKTDNSHNLTIDKVSSKCIDSSFKEDSINNLNKKLSSKKSYDMDSYKLFTIDDYNQCIEDSKQTKEDDPYDIIESNTYSKVEISSDFDLKITDSVNSNNFESKDSINSNKSNFESKDSVNSKDELSELEKIYNKKTNNTTEEKPQEDELIQLENIYNKKVQANYTSNFKFAYVLYLNELYKHPTKKFKENYKELYKATIAKLKKQAKEDGYIVEGSPLSTAKDATVKDIKKVLKKHDLKVSGRKDELIKRLGENLSDEELKKAFPKKSLEVTEEGLSFIESNKYVLYYDKNLFLNMNMTPEEFDSIFTDGYKEENLHDLIIDFLKERENDFVKNKKWHDYITNLGMIVSVYEDISDEDALLDYYFKSFILSLNNYSQYTGKCEPGETYLDYQEINDLIELMHTHSLDLDVLKTRFKNNYDEIKLPNLEVDSEECFIFLLKAFSGEDLINLNSEFCLKHGGEAWNSWEV